MFSIWEYVLIFSGVIFRSNRIIDNDSKTSDVHEEKEKLPETSIEHKLYCVTRRELNHIASMFETLKPWNMYMHRVKINFSSICFKYTT